MRTRHAIALLLLPTFAACSHAKPKQEVVWPSPPQKARIKYVTSFRSTADLDPSGSASFRRWLFGSRDPVLRQPMGFALSDDGERLYVADLQLHGVVVVDLKAKRVKGFGDEGLGNVLGVAIDGDENVWVTDSTNHNVRVFSKAGKTLLTVAEKELERPTGIAIDRARGLVYVADGSFQSSTRHRVLAFDLKGNLVRELGPPAGKAKPGRGIEDGQFHFPTYLAVNKEGHAFVADTMNFRIQEFDADGKFVRKYGQQGDGPGAFASLKGLAFDSFGNLYAVDSSHGNVQMFNNKFELLDFFGGRVDKLEYFTLPGPIAIDRAKNRIYVGNEDLARVNVYDLVNTTADDSFIAPPPPPDEKSLPPAPPSK